ncbi:hypothetical protein LTS18_011551 [Coniosporium uncinatum]|uniref:Uncharacterized protein n=1 Tax=Coniosporium uncinatum TaxID=93489 RepID=A0ACC3D9N3_9PEZI|nr:hypothetical protein LTS18_011551 [Coniosporium uncinatum]
MACQERETLPPPLPPPELEEPMEPEEPPRPQYCTTWPVDEDGKYKPHHGHVDKIKYESIAPKGGWKKPTNFKIIAMVFYGRRRFIDILDCYLQRNLAANGGYVDEVWYMAHTANEEDISWLSSFVQKTENYRFFDLGNCTTGPYGCIWNNATDTDTMYIKIDDDITYVHPDTISRLVHTRMDHPRPFAISANLVNSPLMGYLHYHFGAIHPYLPDPNAAPTFAASETWRPSQLPRYPIEVPESYKVLDMRPPYMGHRWLPLANSSGSDIHTISLLHSPIGKYDSRMDLHFGTAWKSWAIAVQAHYSLLENLERNQLSRYFFSSNLGYDHGRGAGESPSSSQLWDMQFTRYNLNFIAVWGRDIKEHLPIDDDDEEAIGVTIPRWTGRPFVIETRALVAHLNFGPQTDGVEQSDVVDRWRAFVNERICEDTNLKKPFDGR